MKIGIYAPSSPAHIWFDEKYLNAKKRLGELGFELVESELITKKHYQGYRIANAIDRAKDLMTLVEDESIDIIMPVIGGYNTASILPYLDYERIEKSGKIFCGYSDITALHLAILSQTTMPTIYGATVIPTFGEYINHFEYSEKSFIDCLTKEQIELIPPKTWSDQLLNAFSDEWKKEREYKENDGWKIINSGNATGEVIALNINTLVGLLGTKYVPDLSDKILILEEMDASISIEERSLNILKLFGVFDNLRGLIFSKPEVFDDKNSGISYKDLICEVVGNQDYPIIYNFDCGHTHPSISIPQRSELEIIANNSGVKITVLKNSIVNR